MYKELVISIVIIIIIIIANIITQNYTKQCVQEMNQELEILKEQINQERVDDKIANKKVKEIYEKWIQMHNKLAIYIEHDELEKIETDLVATKSNIEIKEYETGIEKIDTCKFILEHVKDKEKLSWTNIF